MCVYYYARAWLHIALTFLVMAYPAIEMHNENLNNQIIFTIASADASR
jgi:hypothetical protein